MNPKLAKLFGNDGMADYDERLNMISKNAYRIYDPGIVDHVDR